MESGLTHLRDILSRVPADAATQQEIAHATHMLNAAEHAVAHEWSPQAQSLRPVLRQLAAGRAIVVDAALAEGSASAALHDARQLLAAGALQAEMPSAHFFPGVPASFASSLYGAVPCVYDMFRLVHWLPVSGSGPAVPALHDISERLRSLALALGRAERQLAEPMSPRWAATGVTPDAHGALLAVSGFNGTRYAMHADDQYNRDRKLTLTYYPHTDGGDAGAGALRVVQAGGASVRVGPRTGRLVLFRADLPHEVEPTASGRPRLSLTVWAHGVGEPRAAEPASWSPAAAPTRHQHYCTSTMCRQRLAELPQTQREHALRMGRVLR